MFICNFIDFSISVSRRSKWKIFRFSLDSVRYISLYLFRRLTLAKASVSLILTILKASPSLIYRNLYLNFLVEVRSVCEI